MKIELAANDLAAALMKIKGAVPSRTTLPILETVLFEASPGELRVTASQINMEATAVLSCDVAEPGRACIAASLIPVVKGLGKSPITLTVPNDPNARAVVAGKRQRYEFGTLPAEDFPQLQTGEACSFEIDAATLRDALALTSATVSDKYEHLAGTNLTSDGANLVFVSTDRNRMTRFKTPAPSGAATVSSHTIPAPAMAAALSMMATSLGGTVRIGLDEHSISFAIDGARLTSRLIGMGFIDCSEVFRRADAFEVAFSASSSEMSEALMRLSAIGGELKQAAIVVETAIDGLKLSTDRRAKADGAEHVDATIDHAARFGVASSFITQLVRSWPESADLNFSAPNPGDAIRITSPNYPELMQLCGPMKIFQKEDAHDSGN